MASTPETSDFTSIKTRIESAQKGAIPDTLARFQGDERIDKTDGIPFSLKDYIELLDITGRAVREDNRGYIENNFSPILNIDTDTWLFIATTFEESFGRAA